VALWAGARRAHVWVASHPRFVVDPAYAKVRVRAPWIGATELDQIRRESGLLGKRYSFFTPNLTGIFEEGYARSSWVRRVIGAKRRYPNRVDVLLEIREPIAGIRLGGDDIHLVDEDGVRLPGTWRDPPVPVWTLTGVAEPPGAAGRVWSEPVRHGASVALDLRGIRPEVARAAGILSLDVGNVGGRIDARHPEIVLRAASGARVEWGRSRLSPRAALDPAPALKLERLAQVLRAYPRLRGLKSVKLQFHEIYLEHAERTRPVRGG
jgi:hypothetical protein